MIPADSIRRRPLVWFFALAHAGSWIGWSPWWLSASGVGLFSYELPPSAVAGINQLGLFAGPFLAAFVVTRIDSGREGVARLWGRIVRWRVTPLAYLIALGIPLVVVGSYLVLPGSPRADEPVSFGVVALLVGTFVVYLLGGPFQEEPGWRGFALPRLQEALHPAAAALVLGVLHCLWHAPLFLTQEWDTPRQDVSQLAAYLVLVVSLSVVLSWLVNVGRGSVLIAILGHHAVNWSLFVVATLTGTAVVDTWPAAAGLAALAVLALLATRGRLGFQR